MATAGETIAGLKAVGNGGDEVRYWINVCFRVARYPTTGSILMMGGAGRGTGRADSVGAWPQQAGPETVRSP
jgi:hypothetical protein